MEWTGLTRLGVHGGDTQDKAETKLRITQLRRDFQHAKRSDMMKRWDKRIHSRVLQFMYGGASLFCSYRKDIVECGEAQAKVSQARHCQQIAQR